MMGGQESGDAEPARAAGEPLVAVVTPVYNGAPWLAECIESVLGQTHQNWTYLIADNCSTDGSGEIADSYAASNSRITVHRHTTHKPAIPNWNRTLTLIPPEAAYCKMVLADDAIYPTCLQRMVEIAEEYPSVGVVSAYERRGDDVALVGLPEDVRFFPGRELCHRVLTTGGYFFGTPTSTLLRADLVRARVPAFYNEDYVAREPEDAERLERLWPADRSVFVHLHADSEVCYALLAEHDFGFVHEVLTYSRMHPASITSRWTARVGTWTPGMLATMLRYSRCFLDDREQRWILRRLVRRYELCMLMSVARLRIVWSADFRRYHSEALERLQPALGEAPVNSRLLSVFRVLLRYCHAAAMWRSRRAPSH
jgi:glycosyltransferase involved in cell wall biosynthesis